MCWCFPDWCGSHWFRENSFSYRLPFSFRRLFLNHNVPVHGISEIFGSKTVFLSFTTSFAFQFSLCFPVWRLECIQGFLGLVLDSFIKTGLSLFSVFPFATNAVVYVEKYRCHYTFVKDIEYLWCESPRYKYYLSFDDLFIYSQWSYIVRVFWTGGSKYIWLGLLGYDRWYLCKIFATTLACL